MSLRIVPITTEQANDFVRLHHRHSKPRLAKFAVGVADDSGLRGVALVGRPVAQKLDNGLDAEILRVCTDGAHNACSILYGACRRALRAIGHQKIYTYTLPDEGGGKPARRRVSARQGKRRRSVETLAQPPRSWSRARG